MFCTGMDNASLFQIWQSILKLKDRELYVEYEGVWKKFPLLRNAKQWLESHEETLKVHLPNREVM